ncbi:MAG: hypothetical protein QXO98_01075 [Sulfolobales archaeon]
MCYIAFDVDGVLMDVDERFKRAEELSKHNTDCFWEIFFNEELMDLDKPRDVAKELINSRIGAYGLIIITGRPRKLYNITLNQLERFYNLRPAKIYMRSSYDRRPASILKPELIGRAINEGFHIVEYHDDEEDVLKKIKDLYPYITLYLHDRTSYKVYWKGI